jgi:hypothetical protein
MKKVSLVGLVLGGLLGVIASLLAGGWLFWLGAGLALGVVIGSAQARRGRLQRSNMGAGDVHL